MKPIKPPIRFRFALDKFISSVAMLAKEKLNDLDKLKICKLLYYADKYHLLKHGKPIIGDIYYHLDNGPVPSKALDIMNGVICEDRVFRGETSNKDKFKEFLRAKRRLPYHRFPVFDLVKDPNLDYLSVSEQEALRDTIKKYGKLTGGQLIDETHKDASWQKTQNTEEIDYRLFFENEKDINPAALEYLESLAEDSEFLFGLSSSD
jgi:uncharacterized phage-associated protein